MTRKHQVLAANELHSGLVVYLQANGCWTTDFGSAAIQISDDDRREAEELGQRAVNNNRLVDPYFVQVAGEAAGLPVHIREQIRLTGPTCKTFAARSHGDVHVSV